jgi:hypothetical protein
MLLIEEFALLASGSPGLVRPPVVAELEPPLEAVGNLTHSLAILQVYLFVFQ